MLVLIFRIWFAGKDLDLESIDNMTFGDLPEGISVISIPLLSTMGLMERLWGLTGVRTMVSESGHKIGPPQLSE